MWLDADPTYTSYINSHLAAKKYFPRQSFFTLSLNNCNDVIALVNSGHLIILGFCL